jgi:cytoskeletal protein CcmA (bactofilin family)
VLFRKPRGSEPAAAEPATFDTVLGAGCKVNGDVTIRGGARVLGEIDGALSVTGDVEIELGGAVRGDLTAERARIAGRIEGDVHVRDALELRTGAHLRGDVYARSFRIQDGAIFQGNCHMGREASVGRDGLAGSSGAQAATP